MWNKGVKERKKEKNEDVKMENMMDDEGGMKIVRWKKKLEVIMKDNMLGEMMQDVEEMMKGQIGMIK